MSPGPALEKFNDPRPPPACEAYPGKRCSPSGSVHFLIAEIEKAEMSVKALEARIDAARAAWKPLPYEDESGVVRLTLGDAATIMVMLGVDRQNPGHQETTHLVRRTLDGVVGRIGCFFGWHLWCWPLPEDGGLNLSEPPPPYAKCKKCGQLYGGKKQEQKQRDADALVKAYPIKLHSPCPPNPTGQGMTHETKKEV